MARGYEKDRGYQDLRRSLQEGRLPSVILMYGREAYLKRWMISEIEKKYVHPAARDFDFSSINGYSLDNADSIIVACEMLPMLSEKRVVHVADFNPKCAGSARLKEYMASIPDTTVLIFTQGERDSLGRGFLTGAGNRAGIYDFGPLDQKTLQTFIRKYLKQTGLPFDPDVPGAMAELTGYFDRDSDYTLDNLRSDIEKLQAYCSGRITVQDVLETAVPNEDRDTFAFMDALAQGDRVRALELLRAMLSYGINEFNILGSICSQFETMMLIREADERGEQPDMLSDRLKINRYRIRILSRPAARYSSEQLKRILMKAYEIDRDVKTGNIEAETALELFVAEI